MITLPANIIQKNPGESGPVVLGRRWKALQGATISFLRHQGYQVEPLKNARFLLKRKGEEDRIVAVKTAADRWPNGSIDTLGNAKTVYLAAFYPRFKTYGVDKPKRLQIVEVDAAVYTKQAQAVRANKDKLKQSGQVFMPLDEEQWKESPNNIGCSAGYILEHGEIAFDEPISWDDGAATDVPEPKPVGSSPATFASASNYQTIIDSHRAKIESELAGLGLPVAQVRIEVTLV